MSVITEALRDELKDPEYSEGYAESFLNAWIATQIKVLREQHGLKQGELAKMVGTKQTGISRIESVNYSAWNIRTLKKLARAFNVRLKVSFETYGSLLDEVEAFSREALQRAPREKDPVLQGCTVDVIAQAPLKSLRVIEFKSSAQEPIGATWGILAATAEAVEHREQPVQPCGTAWGLLGKASQPRPKHDSMPVRPQNLREPMQGIVTA